MAADPALMGVWTRAWAIARGVAPPLEAHGGFRIDVGQPEQRSRYVFPRFDAAIVRALAEAIVEPWVFLKVCELGSVVQPALPPNWVLQSPRFMMIADFSDDDPPTGVPRGFAVQMGEEAGMFAASVVNATGASVARGRMIVLGRHAVLDRVSTDENHRRRGLGRALVGAPSARARRLGATEGILSATASGRQLYATLGWKVHSDYSSFVVPGDA